MRALVFTGPSAVEVQDVPEPAVGPDEVLVHVAASGICGSELHGVRTPGFRVPPLVMGHEFAGLTSDGRSVVVNPILSCGSCDVCRLGRRNVCRRRQIIGVHRPGGFAERVAVPESALVELPQGLGWTAAGIVEPAANAVHAWSLAGAPAGFDAAALVRGEQRVLGSFAYTDEDFATAVRTVGEWDVSWVRTCPLADGAELFTALMNGRDTPVKALLGP
ncbi:alcohol dehydrogenase catalytic domain-containing protein [Nonomuraea sp. NPDC001699]